MSVKSRRCASTATSIPAHGELVFEDGRQLSAGEGQRVAMARALLADLTVLPG